MTEQAVQGALANRALTKACQVLTGIVTGIVADGHLHDMEIQMLNTWLSANSNVTQSWPGSAISKLIQNVLADGHIDDQERQHLLQELQALVGSDFADTGSVSHDVIKLPFDTPPNLTIGTRLCFTGAFLYGTRNACEKLATQHGLEPLDGVSKKVNALIVGSHISPDWVNTSYGRKIIRAMELREEGHQIQIVHEAHWLELLNTITT